MNALTKTENNALAPVTMGFNDLASFEFLQLSAKAFAASTMVPTAYQGMITKGYGDNASTQANPAAISNCMIALDMAQRMNANPLMIMQNLHIIEGRPSWSSQFIIAAINNCGKFSPLRFDLEWLDEMDATYSTYEWVNRQKTEKKHVVRVKNARCVAWAVEKATGERLESAPVTMEMAVNEGWYGKNGSKWRSMPDLMLRYRSAAFFGRIYAPELLMGLPTAEEVQDVFVDVPRDMETAPVPGGVKHMGAADEVKQALPAYPPEKWDLNSPKWINAIATGAKTLADTLAWLHSKYTITAEQEKSLEDAVALAQQAANADAPAVDPDALIKAIGETTDLDKVYELGSQIDAITDEAQRLRVTETFEARVAELEG